LKSVLVAGVAVSSMMFGTTVLTYMVMLMIWETNFFLATAFLIGFGFIDMVFTTGLHHHSFPCCSALLVFLDQSTHQGRTHQGSQQTMIVKTACTKH